MDYSKYVNPRKDRKVTPQSKKIPGKKMKANSAGGFSFKVDNWDRLDRFLVLGTEGGTYYINERKLTKENAKAVSKLLKKDGVAVVNRVVEISDEGRAPRNDAALFVLAMASAADDVATRKAALAALPKVARIGTHLFHYAQFVSAFRGWGRALRNAVAGWYNDKDLSNLEYQVMKYKQRDGWSHRDLLRLAHPKTDDVEKNTLFKYIVKPEDVKLDSLSDRMQAAVAASKSDNAKEVVNLIVEYNLPREVINTALLNDKRVWEALLAKMPMTAMIRNLGKMTSVGLLEPMSDASSLVIQALGDKNRLGKARIHPLAVLSALKVYAQGRGVRGNLSWTPDQRIVDALDQAFYDAFKNVTPSNKRLLLALDVSGSMMSPVSGLPFISCREASAVLALVTAAVESQYVIKGFTSGTRGYGWYNRNQNDMSGFIDLDVSPRMRLDTVLRNTSNLPFGGTDCALPMLWASKTKTKIDTFVVYTDSETWAGNIHPCQALTEYRNKTGIPAKLVVVGMNSNGFTIADPNDAGMLDVVGFDTATPEIIRNFVVEGA